MFNLFLPSQSALPHHRMWYVLICHLSNSNVCTKYLEQHTHTHIDIQRLHCATQIEVSNSSCSFIRCYSLLFWCQDTSASASSREVESAGAGVGLQWVSCRSGFVSDKAISNVKWCELTASHYPISSYFQFQTFHTSLEIGKRSQLMLADCCPFAWVLPERLTFWYPLRE